MTVHRSKRPTQLDVAQAAGVSQAVVSYVLNDKSAVAITPQTRSRVLDAVEHLGYFPNSAARSLRTKKTFTIAAVIPDITNPFYPAFARGIQDVAEANLYDVVIVNTDGDEAMERKTLQSLRRGSVDGLIMTPFHATPADASPLLLSGTAMVVLGDSHMHWAEHGVDIVIVEQSDGACAAVNYLIEKGHTRIGMIAGVRGTPPRENRVEGYLRALAEHHIPLDNILIRAGDYTEAGGYEGMSELLRLAVRPTAVFAANDLMALGALLALREAGLRVPDDMAIVGFDDIAVAGLVNPPLTTVAQFPGALGKRTAELLLERIRGTVQGSGRVEWMPSELVIRQSA